MLLVMLTMAIAAGTTRLPGVADFFLAAAARRARVAGAGAGRARDRGAGRERAHPRRQSGDASGADDGARGDGARVLRPPSRHDRGGEPPEAGALPVADRLPVRAVRHGAGGGGACRRGRSAPAPISARSLAGAVMLGVWEVGIAKMRVFRVGEFLGGAFVFAFLADPARLPVAGGAAMNHAYDVSHLLAGLMLVDELHAALPGSHLRGASTRSPLQAMHAVAGGGLGGLGAGAARTSSSPPRIALRAEGHRHPDRAAAASSSSSASTATSSRSSTS